ncbi:MAG: NAD(P)H-hydrate dehydratase [Polaromonas sp.]|nr:NAD(P)H-hydrate dehydratase [Polaromonas sp.]
MQKISSACSHPLYDMATVRRIEQQAAQSLAPHTLMQRAGLAVARLALALAPHARCIWIACGPGNNGGDGFAAALQLHRWGKRVVVTWTGLPNGQSAAPPDAQTARQQALAAGVPMASEPPAEFDLCIDALLGIGAALDPGRTENSLMHDWLARMRDSSAPRLSVDVPTGLNADTGAASAYDTIDSVASNNHRSSAKGLFTLSLLTLKPGLFTASGRDCAGQVWLDDLGVTPADTADPLFPVEPCAWLLGADRASGASPALAAHASHKGSFGDVAVLGGESAGSRHMAGAALLAASAALHAGAGRVLVALLGDPPALAVDLERPELMFRPPDALDMARQVIVCGCGGGEMVKSVLPRVLSAARRAVLDADALNAVARDTQLQTLLKARQGRGHLTILTPHPLEAARLLGCSAAAVQADRLGMARQLAERFGSVVVLKGSGTVVAAPGGATFINSTGNALLATAGTGDVLAGLAGACLARGMSAVNAAAAAVFEHGRRADCWAASKPGEALTASALARLRAG